MWEFGGLWNEAVWRRKPDIRQTSLCMIENGEKLWLYCVEDEVIMIEVKPIDFNSSKPEARSIGQVVLKRLIDGDQAIEMLSKAESFFKAEAS